jgi:hypothetical protein
MQLLLPAHLSDKGNAQVCAAPFSGNINITATVGFYGRDNNGKVEMLVRTRNAAGQS